MARQSEHTRYVVHFEDGRTSDPLDLQTIRNLIERNDVTIRDRISREGSPPAEFYLYDEFVDLWDLDTELLGLYDEGDREGTAGAPADIPGAPPAIPGEGERLESKPSLEEVRFLEEIPKSLASSADFVPVATSPRLTAIDEKAVEEAMPPPLAFGTIDEAAVVADQPIGPSAVPPSFEPSTQPSSLAEPVMTGSGEFRGYDPLQDNVLDPMTVFDLLVDSSLYTALAVSPRATLEQIHEAYLNRVGQLAVLQRQAKRTDRAQVAALEGIRRLIFQTQEVLRDSEKRQQYHQAGEEGGGFPPAGSFLGIRSPEEESPAAGLPAGTAAPSVLLADTGLTREPSPDLPLPAVAAEPSRTDLGPRVGPTPRDFSRSQQGAGLRVYSSPFEAISRKAPSGAQPITDLFDGPPAAPAKPTGLQPPRPARRAQAESRQPRRRRKGPGEQADFPAGLQWGAAETPGQSIKQTLLLTAVATITSLAVVIFTGLGRDELNYNSPSAWFFGRAGLLLVLAVVGTTTIRQEPFSRMGFSFPLRYLALGAGAGVILGIVGSLLAPISIEGAALIWVSTFMLMALEAVSHELFFRGYVTRVLLVGSKVPAAAIGLSCLFYGMFYLSYWNVTQIRGYFMFYYSILLFGFGVGGVFAWLYYRSRSIWPSVIAHFLAICLSALLVR